MSCAGCLCLEGDETSENGAHLEESSMNSPKEQQLLAEVPFCID